MTLDEKIAAVIRQSGQHNPESPAVAIPLTEETVARLEKARLEGPNPPSRW